MNDSSKHPLPDVRGKRVVLLLQGGGALGAYHVGAFESLQAHLEKFGRKRVDWVAGISIGAINAAVIAGNAPEDLLPSYKPADVRELGQQSGPPLPASKLEQLWTKISLPGGARTAPRNDAPLFRAWSERQDLLARYAAFDSAATFGLPNFFQPRLWSAWSNPWITQWRRGALAPNELAYYDTEPLRRMLADPGQVNWDLINNAAGEGRTRLSLGATCVTDAEIEFFDSNAFSLGPEHVLASGALPPAFPPIRIGEKYYFDGGVSSNTPLLDLQDELASEPTIVFDIHVWDRQGEMPRTMDELAWRQKCIQYGSRKRIAETIVDMHQHRPATGAKPTLVVYQVMYEYGPGASGDPGDSAFAFSDADFAPATLQLRREVGRRDMRDALLFPHLVEGVGGDRAALYRHGTYGKHLATDRRIGHELSGAGVTPQPGTRIRSSDGAETAHVAGMDAGAESVHG